MRFKITANGTVTLNLRFTGQFLKSYLFVLIDLDDLPILNYDVYRSVFDGFNVFFDLCKSFFSNFFWFRHPYSFRITDHRRIKKDLGQSAFKLTSQVFDLINQLKFSFLARHTDCSFWNRAG